MTGQSQQQVRPEQHRPEQPQVRAGMQKPELKEPSAENTRSEAALDKKTAAVKRDGTSRPESPSQEPSAKQRPPAEQKWPGTTLRFSEKSSKTGKTAAPSPEGGQLKGDRTSLQMSDDKQKFTTLTGKTYSFNDTGSAEQSRAQRGAGAESKLQGGAAKKSTGEPPADQGRLGRSAAQPSKEDMMNAYIRSFRNAASDSQKSTPASFAQQQGQALTRGGQEGREPEKSAASLRERMTTAFSERKAQPEMIAAKRMEEAPQQKGQQCLKEDGAELSLKRESPQAAGDNAGRPVEAESGAFRGPVKEQQGSDREPNGEKLDGQVKKTSFDAYKSVFKSMDRTGQAEPEDGAAREGAQAETGKTEQPKNRDGQSPLLMQGAAATEEKKLPPAPVLKDKSADEAVSAEKRHEYKSERDIPAERKPAVESHALHSSEQLKSVVKKETEKTSSETAARSDEEPASPKEKTAEPKAPLREKSFIAPSKDRKSPADEAQSALRGDGSSGQSTSQLGERVQMMSSWTSGMAARDELRTFSSQSGSARDRDKLSSAADRQAVDAVERRERNFNQSQSDQDSSQDGSSRERARAGNTAKPQGRPAESAVQQRAAQAPEQQPHDFFRKETAKQQLDERVKVFSASKDQPIKHTMQAAQHATTSIESVLKKSHRETWTGDEMAAKLIALLMKSSSEYTYDHSTRVIDLSVMLAREIGISDEKSLKDIEDGAMFHDIGEVELDLEKAPQGVKNRLSNYIGIADLKNCSFLHDIGKIKIPDEILYKPSRLTDEEYEVLKQHPIIGEQILKPIPSMQHVVPVVRHHHERWDGKGYPDGLEGNEIPQSARIISITDAFDAMISDRPYRKGMPVQEAIKEIKKGAGTQFDPNLVEAFLKVVEKQYL
jgi:HD-GYP domain-containing protein (c-di-GMP phosphodiesterase class II)